MTDRQALIDLGAITANVTALVEHVRGTAVMAVVKADGYGHGIVPAAQEFQDRVVDRGEWERFAHGKLLKRKGAVTKHGCPRLLSRKRPNYLPPTRARSWAFSSNAAITASSSPSPASL